MEDERFYGKYKQYLQEKGGFPSEQQLAEHAANGDDSASDDTVDD